MEQMNFRSIRILFCILGLLIPIIIAYSQEEKQVEILMSPDHLASMSLSEIHFNSRIECIGRDLFLLLSDEAFYLLTGDGLIQMNQIVGERLQSVSYYTDGLFISTIDNELNIMDTLGFFHHVLDIPHFRMELVTGNHGLYLYDQEKTFDKYSIYVLRDSDASLVKLIDTPSSISCLIECGDKPLFASNNTIYAIDINNACLERVIELGQNELITSMAYSANYDCLFFTTTDAIYSVKEGVIRKVCDASYSTICCDTIGLVIFKYQERVIYRLGYQLIIES